jgi:hypothetical protein
MREKLTSIHAQRLNLLVGVCGGGDEYIPVFTGFPCIVFGWTMRKLLMASRDQKSIMLHFRRT